MSNGPSLVAAFRAGGVILDERFQEVEAHVGSLITRASDLDLEIRAALRRVEMLERRLSRLETKVEGSRAAEAGS